jgi:transcriptional regulator with XRE-family HTH domain
MDDDGVNDNNERAIKTLGALVKEARVARGLSQRQFAEIAGVDYKTLGSFERGDRTPRDISLAKIEVTLGWRKGSIERELNESTIERIDILTVADMEGAPGEDSWEDLAEKHAGANGIHGNGPVKRASLLTDEELLAEISYRFRNYYNQSHGDSP